MKLRILMLYILFCIVSCSSSIDLYECSIDHPYKFSAEIEETLQKDTTIWKYEPAAWAYSRIGEHEQSLFQWEKSREALHNAFGFRDVDSLNIDTILQNYELKNAIDYINQEAVNYKVLIVNEAHHNPRHRTFTTQLLPKLSSLGYTKIGFEAVVDSINRIKNHPSFGLGFYTAEPQFGELLRASIQNNFELFGYDDDGELQGAEREKYQAKMIFEQLQKNPNAKIIIHCGFGHHREDAKSNTMGYYLKSLYGIDPLTIDQERYNEQHSGENEHELYKKLLINESSVLMNDKGVAFTKDKTTSPEIDIQVFHPRTKYITKRPNWLEYNDKIITEVPIPISDLNCPCLVFAFPKSEEIDKSIPVDIFEMTELETSVFLSLKEKESYKIIIQNINGDGRGFEFKTN